MTPEQQRITIAEVCGWTPDPFGYYTKDPAGLSGPRYRLDELPNYFSDLNAMHEAEKVLTEEQHRRFSWHLVQVTDDNYRTWSAFEYETLSVWEMSLGDVQACLRATAAQRAEAFLRTLNLWTTG